MSLRPEPSLPIIQMILLFVAFSLTTCKDASTNPETGENEVDETNPNISIEKKHDGATVHEAVSFRAESSDNKKIEGVTFYLTNADNSFIDSITVQNRPFIWEIDTKKFINDNYTMYAKAMDQAENIAYSDTLAFKTENYLFSHSFGGTWTSVKGFLTITDTIGNVIEEIEFTGKTSVNFKAQESTSEKGKVIDPGEIDVTIGWKDNSSQNNIYLYSYLNVKTWSDWKINAQSDQSPIGDIQLTYSDTTGYNSKGYVLSTEKNTNSDAWYRISFNDKFTIFEDPTTLYAAYNTAEVPYSKEIKDVNNNQNVNLDLSSGVPMLSKSTAMPPGQTPRTIYAYVYGNKKGSFKNEFLVYEGFYSSSKIDLWYPDKTFTEYRTKITSRYDSDEGVYIYHTQGLPSQVKKLTLDPNFVSAKPADFHVETSHNNFDGIWVYSTFDAANNSFGWQVEGPSYRNQFSFPKIGEQFKNAFPEFNRNSFNVVATELYKYPKLDDGYHTLNQQKFEEQKYYRDVVSEYVSYQYIFTIPSKQPNSKINKFFNFKAGSTFSELRN